VDGIVLCRSCVQEIQEMMRAVGISVMNSALCTATVLAAARWTQSVSVVLSQFLHLSYTVPRVRTDPAKS